MRDPRPQITRIRTLRRHTDARSASLLIDGDGYYSAIRSFGDVNELDASENDAALSQFAYGVGSAFDALREKRGDENADLRELIVNVAADLRVLSERLLPRSAAVVRRPIENR